MKSSAVVKHAGDLLRESDRGTYRARKWDFARAGEMLDDLPRCSASTREGRTAVKTSTAIRHRYRCPRCRDATTDNPTKHLQNRKLNRKAN